MRVLPKDELPPTPPIRAGRPRDGSSPSARQSDHGNAVASAPVSGITRSRSTPGEPLAARNSAAFVTASGLPFSVPTASITSSIAIFPAAGEPGAIDTAKAELGNMLDAESAAALGLVTAALDEIDWEDEIRVFLEERASFSADALTGLEANLRFAGPETMESKIFARLTAWLVCKT